ncbi:transducin/WD40 repeat-like superfamily protein [Striga asiatica]|uniref:Transducin/WD40 repeat-like superfamily protein n=1 Tax=Striga asiatica TaxID=4170 RepID=A0A5A7P3M9_STRAF|nr:transducin/WD40 repeat-like superfamily protein [Striga asiatica]
MYRFLLQIHFFHLKPRVSLSFFLHPCEESEWKAQLTHGFVTIKSLPEKRRRLVESLPILVRNGKESIKLKIYIFLFNRSLNCNEGSMGTPSCVGQDEELTQKLQSFSLSEKRAFLHRYKKR